MAWTSFWTDEFRKIKKQFSSIKHNPTFIQTSKADAIPLFEDLFGEGILNEGNFEIETRDSLEESTAYFRGCRITDFSFVEESYEQSRFKYHRLGLYLNLTGIKVIYRDEVAETFDGARCVRCRDFFLMAEVHFVTKEFTCRACKFNPYR